MFEFLFRPNENLHFQISQDLGTPAFGKWEIAPDLFSSRPSQLMRFYAQVYGHVPQLGQ